MPTILFNQHIPPSWAHPSCSHLHNHAFYENRNSLPHPRASFELLYLSFSSVSSVSFSLLLFLLLCDLLFFCSSSVFSNCDIFPFTFLLFAPAHYLAVLLISLSLSYDFGLSFCCPIFLHSIAFIFPCVFSHSFSFLLPSLFFFLGCLLTSSFLFICLFLIEFFVSFCFSYDGFLMFLWFLLHCILSFFPLSSISIFRSFFLVNSLSVFGSCWLSSRLLFFLFSFNAFKLLLLCFFWVFFVFLYLFALRLIIYF